MNTNSLPLPCGTTRVGLWTVSPDGSVIGGELVDIARRAGDVHTDVLRLHYSSSGTPSKKHTVPVSSEYSAPTTSRPLRAISRSRSADPWRR